MVGYTFQKSFREPIFAREKQQTIRLPRKRRTRQGDDLSFFTGQRMRPIRWGSALVLSAAQVRLDFAANTVTLDDVFVISRPDELDAFALRDGFRVPDDVQARWTEKSGSALRPWDYMAHWWRFTHPDKPIFVGDLVFWGDTFKPAEGQS